MNKYSSKSVLIGIWEGGAGDGSGLRTMIYNWGLEFYDDGRGVSFDWQKTDGGYDEDEFPFEWEYISENKIRIRSNLNSQIPQLDIVEYEISDFIGAYGVRYIKLVQKGEERFWNSPEPLYKPKPAPNLLGWLRRIFPKRVSK